MRQKYFSAKGETSNPELFALQEVISEYMPLNILLHRENAHTENKRTWKYAKSFAVFS